MKLSFIGLGKLGLPCAEVFAEKGHFVKGYDIQNVSSNLIKIENSIQNVVLDTDIVFIAVPTPHDPLYDGRFPISHLSPKDFDYSIALAKLNPRDFKIDKILYLYYFSEKGTLTQK
jgi:UDPglucose 6-dehydrogenase